MRSDNSVGLVEDKRAKEIPTELALFGKVLEEQEEAIHSLRDALRLVLREEAPVRDGNEKADPINHSELGSQLKGYRRQITSTTQIIQSLLSRLEL